METHRLALTPGYQIEHFRIESILGKGGFGITYMAMDLQLGKRVAIKELLPDSIATRMDGSTVVPQSASLQENWEWARERFLDEARMLAGFSHPAIVGVHRRIEANGTVYMVMDYVDGESYEARLRRIGREPDQASLMAVIGPILRGLEEVHNAGLIHRDIKTENILINRHGQPVLIDFGSARSAVGATMTMTSIVTHGYSPIEQYQTKGKMGPWTDMYAMGAVMCRAITGEKPPVAADRIVDDDFIWLSNRGLTEYDGQFLTAVDWALRVRPEGRPQQIADWEPHLASSTGNSPQMEFAAREEIRVGLPVADPPEKRTSPEKPRNKSAIIAAITITAAIGFVVAAMYGGHVKESARTAAAAEMAREQAAKSAAADRIAQQAEAVRPESDRKAAEARAAALNRIAREAEAARQEFDRKAAEARGAALNRVAWEAEAPHRNLTEKPLRHEAQP
jgi:serine/threonine protein kinase